MVPAPRRKRYSWTRINNNFPDLPAFRAAAAIARARVHQVVAVALRLDCVANVASPRGSVADMSVPEFAAALQLPADVVARIRAALEDPDIGYIVADFVTDFYERNPDDCDLTAADRQRRHREKLREARRDLPALTAAGPPVLHSNVPSRRDTVTVTARDGRSKPSLPSEVPRARASGAAAGLSSEGTGGAVFHDDYGDSGENPGPELWLATEGERIVIERMQVVPARAKQLLERWRELAGDSHSALADVIAAADRADYVAARFHNLVVDGCKRVPRQVEPQLPLPPMPIGRRRAVGDD